MRHDNVRTIAFACLLVAALPGAAAAEAARVLTEHDVMGFMVRWAEAEKSEDFDNFLPLIHPDAVYRTSDRDYAGLASIRQSMEGTFAGGSDQNYYMEDIEVSYVGQESATVTYSWNWTGETPVGVPFHITGRGTKVLVRGDDGLQVRLIHLNQDTVSAGGLKMRSNEDQQALLENRIAMDGARFDSIAGRYLADGELTLEFYREADKAYVRMVETGFVGEIVPIAANHYLLLTGHDVAYRFLPEGTLESQLGPRLRFYKKQS